MKNASSFTGVRAKGYQSEPGFFVLKSAAGVENYLWIDSTGDLRVATAKPAAGAYDSAGTIVGTQS